MSCRAGLFICHSAPFGPPRRVCLCQRGGAYCPQRAV